MNRTTSALAILMVVVLGASPVLAKGMYVGAGIGNTFYSSEFSVDDVTDQVTNIDENSTAWKIFGGYKGNGIIGIEGGYRDFGNVSTDVEGGTFETSTTGWDIEALAHLEITLLDLFAKAGVLFSDTSETYPDGAESSSDTNFLWGLGAGVHLGTIGARLEWESVAVSGSDNLSVVSLSATLGF